MALVRPQTPFCLKWGIPITLLLFLAWSVLAAGKVELAVQVWLSLLISIGVLNTAKQLYQTLLETPIEIKGQNRKFVARLPFPAAGTDQTGSRRRNIMEATL